MQQIKLGKIDFSNYLQSSPTNLSILEIRKYPQLDLNLAPLTWNPHNQ